MIRTVTLIALPLALCACGQSQPAPETEPSAVAPAEAIASAKLVVDADGVAAKGSDPLRFGADRADVDAAAAQAFGAAPQQSSNPECGAGPMDFSAFGPLRLGYLDGRFAGWFLGEGEGVATSDGVIPGVTTLEGLQLERRVRKLDTTLDGEFQYTTADYGTITGFADPDGSITGLAAGVTCFFR